MTTPMFKIRLMTADDRAVWIAMRCALWPSDGRKSHADGVDELLKCEEAWGFVAEAADGVAIGFAELALRANMRMAATASPSRSSKAFGSIVAFDARASAPG